MKEERRMRVRKMIAALAAVSMLTAFSAQAVMAADAITISAEKVKAKAGAEFTLNIDMSGVPAEGISVCEFAVTYDPSVVTVSGVTAGGIVGTPDDSGMDGAPTFGSDTATEGMVTFTYAVVQDDAAYYITKDGTFATITGKVAEGAEAGTESPIKIVAIERPVTEGSTEMNDSIYAGRIDGNDPSTAVVTTYDVTVADGSVTVVGEGETQATDDTSGDGDTLYGDVDEDGAVKMVDMILLNKYLMIGEPVTPQGLKNADVNCDGEPDQGDALNILRSVIGLVELPIK